MIEWHLGQDVKIDGQTFEEFANELFEYEYCADCGGDVEDHEGWIVLGHWFAHCKTTEGGETT